MRHPVLGTAGAAFLALGLVACGGGGGGGTPVGTAALKGSVLMVNGSTANVGGVVLTDPRTGQSVVTSSNGAFDFGTVPAGTITLHVGALAATVRTAGQDAPGTDTTDGDGSDTESGTETETETGDNEASDDSSASQSGGDGDSHDVGDSDADVTGVADGEDVEVHVSIRDGKIESIEVSRSGHDDRGAQVELTRGAESDDPDTVGSARFALDDERSFIRIAAEQLDTGRVVEWFMLDLTGTPESEGTRTVDADGRAVWEVTTKNGGTLPFGVASVTDLEGFQIEVRDATTGIVLLFGTVPQIPVSAHGEDGSHHGSDDGVCLRGRALLPATAGTTGEAHVAVESRTGEEAREELKFEVEGMTAGTVLQVWLENPNTLALENVGTITVGAEGEGELEFDSHEGHPLPFGAANVAALAGMNVEIRANDGTTVDFSGQVPAANVQ